MTQCVKTRFFLNLHHFNNFEIKLPIFIKNKSQESSIRFFFILMKRYRKKNYEKKYFNICLINLLIFRRLKYFFFPIFVKFFQISPNFGCVQLGHFLLILFKSLTAMNSNCHVSLRGFFFIFYVFIYFIPLFLSCSSLINELIR